MIFLSRSLHFFVLHRAFVFGGSLAGFVLLLAGLLLVGDALMETLGRARTLLLLILPILGMPCLLAIAVFSLLFAPTLNRVFVVSHGVPGTGVITEIVSTAGAAHQYRTLIRRSGSPTLTSTLFENAAFYPKPKSEDLALPTVDAPFAVLTIPGDESNFVILTSDTSTGYGRALHCASLRNLVLTSASEAHLQPSGSTAVLAYQTRLDDYAGSNCPTLIAIPATAPTVITTPAVDTTSAPTLAGATLNLPHPTRVVYSPHHDPRPPHPRPAHPHLRRDPRSKPRVRAKRRPLQNPHHR